MPVFRGPAAASTTGFSVASGMRLSPCGPVILAPGFLQGKDRQNDAGPGANVVVPDRHHDFPFADADPALSPLPYILGVPAPRFCCGRSRRPLP